ncbi:EamA family transporter, partial [Myxococcota bacterium]|nr:EamA family transporter [Myxococcota bacterium]
MSATSSALGARLSIIGAALLWSTGGAAIKLADATAAQISVGRSLVAGVVLFAVFPGARMRWSRSVLLTGLAYACTSALFVFANTLTTAANVIFIQNVAPVWVLLLGPWLLGERATRAEKISVPISLAGCLLFFADDFAAGRLAGNVAAAAASVTYALLIIRYRKTPEHEGLAATIAGNAMVAGALGAVALSGPSIGAAELGVMFYLGAIQQAVAAVLFVRGIQGTSAMEGALLILFEPLLSPVWAFVLVGERPGPLALLGAATILAAT